MARILVLLGPTAVGKTACIDAIADQFSAVVYADTACLYKDLHIGTAKPSAREQSRIPHYLIDLLDLDQSFDAGDFFQHAQAICTEYAAHEKPLIISGGTFFYIYNFLFGLSQAPAPRPGTREHWRRRLEEEGLETLRQFLFSIDPITAERLRPNDGYRILRALEVHYDTGRPLSSFPRPSTLRSEHEWLIIALQRPRNELYARINARVEDMWRQGLPQEIEYLKKEKGAGGDSAAMKAIGYRQFFMDLPDLQAVKTQIQLDSRHYAKRQITFLNQFPIHHFCAADDIKSILGHVENWLKMS